VPFVRFLCVFVNIVDKDDVKAIVLHPWDLGLVSAAHSSAINWELGVEGSWYHVLRMDPVPVLVSIRDFVVFNEEWFTSESQPRCLNRAGGLAGDGPAGPTCKNKNKLTANCLRDAVMAHLIFSRASRLTHSQLPHTSHRGLTSLSLGHRGK